MEGGGETFGSAFAPRFASLIRLRGSGREAFLEPQVYLQRSALHLEWKDTRITRAEGSFTRRAQSGSEREGQI